jgi:hypothetical protein
MEKRTLRLTWLLVGVTSYWLLVFAAISLAAPVPAKAARTPHAVFVPGSLATIYAPPLKEWPIPTDRTTFDDYQRAVRESDEGGITDVIGRPGWVPVADQQRVRVAAVDGTAVRVELIDGQHTGERGWPLARQLRP